MITLGTVAARRFGTRVGVLVGIALLMTVGVYGLVAGIVKLDDVGLYLRCRAGAAALQPSAAAILVAAPWLMKGCRSPAPPRCSWSAAASSPTASRRCITLRRWRCTTSRA